MTSVSITTALADRYRVERELGTGGMATVYLAHDLRHDRDVAIKVLHPDLAAALGGERFLSEIKTTARLQHPHILPLLDSGEAAGLLYYVMPLVSGETLRARLEREKQLPIADALSIAREVADALGYAHSHGVIHRDIKPENILLQGGHALVADFGIALAVQQAGGQRMTQTGLSLGTPQYMSPEQAMGERTIDARSDVYALAAVLYEMLAGEPPFTGPTVQAIVAKVLTDSARPVNQLRKSVPEHVAAAISAALEKLPADRLGSAEDFSAALAGASVRTVAVSGSNASLRRNSVAALATAGVVLVAVSVVSTAWVLSSRRDQAKATSVSRVRFSFPATIGGSGGELITISPDGSTIVYHARDAGTARGYLAIRKLDDETSVEIPGTERADAPFFSPDGKSIGFRQGSRLMRGDLSGAADGARVIIDSHDAMAAHAAWSKDGMIISSRQNGKLFVVGANGGEARLLPRQDSATYGNFRWLPDGKRVLATRSRVTGDSSTIVVLSGETGELLARIAPGISLQYLPNDDVVYLSGEGALMRAHLDSRSLKVTGTPAPVAVSGIPRYSVFARTFLIAVSASGAIAFSNENVFNNEMLIASVDGKVTPLPLGKRAFRGPRFSPDGKRIAVDVESGGDLIGDVWIYDRDAGTFARLTFEGGSVFPEWTPDGRSVLYASTGPGGSRDRELYEVPVDRSAAPKIVAHGASPIFEGVGSPNGGPLFLRVNAQKTGRDILVSRDGGKPEPFAASPAEERSLALSADGQFVLYTSNESGADEVYLRRADGAGRTQVSTAGGTEPRWIANGREALYWAGDTLFAVPVTTTPNLAVGGRRRVLTGTYARESYHTNYDVVPDGKSFVMIRGVNSVGGEITVLANWIDVSRTPRK